MVQKRVPPLTSEFELDFGIAEQSASLRARMKDAKSAEFHHRRGMSRTRLSEIYGQDLVNMIWAQ